MIEYSPSNLCYLMYKMTCVAVEAQSRAHLAPDDPTLYIATFQLPADPAATGFTHGQTISIPLLPEPLEVGKVYDVSFTVTSITERPTADVND